MVLPSVLESITTQPAQPFSERLPTCVDLSVTIQKFQNNRKKIKKERFLLTFGFIFINYGIIESTLRFFAVLFAVNVS
jgi:hypothetical protein